MKRVDMSPSAIARRLKQMEQLRRLSLSLMKAKAIGEEEALELRRSFRERKRNEAAENAAH